MGCCEGRPQKPVDEAASSSVGEATLSSKPMSEAVITHNSHFRSFLLDIPKVVPMSYDRVEDRGIVRECSQGILRIACLILSH